MAGRSGRVLKGMLGILVSAALIYWLVVSMEWSEVFAVLQTANYWILLPVTLLHVLHFVLRGMRWNYLLPTTPDVPMATLRDRVDAILVGAFATYVLPLRAGEFVRPLLLSRTAGVPFSVGFASVVLERFFDLAAVLMTFGIFLFVFHGFPAWAYHGAIILAVIAAIIFFGLLATALKPLFIRRVLATVVGPLPQKLGQSLLTFFDGISAAAEVLRDPGRMFGTVILTIPIWLSAYAITYGYLFLFPVEPSVLVAVGTSVILALAVAAPSAPGFIGVYQTAWVGAFVMFNLPQEQALGYAILSHVHQYVMFVAYGGIYLLIRGIRLGDLTRKPAANNT